MKTLLALLSLASLTLLSAQPVWADMPYAVKNGQAIDAETYNGFKLFRNWCARCHGTYGQGLVGPNLANSLKTLSRQEFMDIVADGQSGQIGSMPAWRSNQQVMEGREYIYRYLKARADGAIGEVTPRKIK